MKKLLFFLLFLLVPLAAHAQLGNVVLHHFPGVPAGACGRNQFAVNDATGDLYNCLNGAWHATGTSISTPVSLANGGTGSSSPCSTLNAIFRFNGSVFTCDPLAILDGSGDASFNSLTLTGTGGTTMLLTEGVSPGNPGSAGTENLYVDSTSHLLTCLNHTGGSCIPATGITTANGQTGSTVNVNSGATAHGVAVNEGNGNAIGGTSAGTGNQILASGGASADPAYKSLADLQTRIYVVGGGTAQAQTAILPDAATSLTAGLYLRWLPAAANTAAGPTLAVNGLTATAITKCGTIALVAGDLSTTAVAIAIYDGTQFQLQNPQVIGCGPTATGPLASGNSGINVTRVSGSDFTTGSTSLVAITGLSFTLPASTAANYKLECDVYYSDSATSGTGIVFGFQDVTTSPTSARLSIDYKTAGNTASSNVANVITNTTATAITGTIQPSTTNLLSARITGVIEQPSGSASVIQIMGQIASGTLTVAKDSTCELTVTAN